MFLLGTNQESYAVQTLTAKDIERMFSVNTDIKIKIFKDKEKRKNPRQYVLKRV